MDESLDETLEEKLAVTDDTGRVVVRIGLLATFYFENAYQPEVREAVASCFDDYQRLCGSHLRWKKNPKTFRFSPMSSSRVPSPRDWLNRLGEDFEWEFDFRGGETVDEANNFSVSAYGSAKWQHNLSYFNATLPITWFADHPGNFPAVVLEFCRKLKPLSGYGGLGILESPNGLIEQKFGPAVYTIAQRFPGLEVDHPVTHTLYLDNGIKGVNWLTILGDYWLKKVGGVLTLKEQLGKNFISHEFPGGVMIQAGPRPQMGDRDQGRMPDLYAQLARVLKPIRITKHRPFSYAHEEGQRFDKEASEKWLARFD